MPMNYQLLISDDHPLFRRALEEAVEAIDIPVEVSQADNFPDTLALLEENPETDLVLLDLKMPGNDGLMGLIQIRKAFPHIGVAIVSATQDINIIAQALKLGAIAYIPKSMRFELIQSAIQSILNGDKWIPEAIQARLKDFKPDNPPVTDGLATLTPKQLRVLSLIGKGYLNKQIADQLNIKETTIKTHVSEILRKLGLNNRTQAAALTRLLDVSD